MGKLSDELHIVLSPDIEPDTVPEASADRLVSQGLAAQCEACSTVLLKIYHTDSDTYLEHLPEVSDDPTDGVQTDISAALLFDDMD